MTDDNGSFELTRRKALLGLSTVGAASAAAGMGTTAFLNDEEGFDGNSLTAGELDLFVDYETSVSQAGVDTSSTTNDGTIDGGESKQYVIKDVKPGDSGYMRFCFSVVDNPAYLWMTGELTDDSDPSVNEPEGSTPWERDGTASGELATFTRASLSYRDLGASAFGATITEGSLKGVLAELAAGLPLHGNGDPTSGVLNRPVFGPNSDKSDTDDICVQLNWEVPKWVGNEIQNDSVSFDITFNAVQSRHNDGSGEWTVVRTGDDLGTAVANASSGDTLLLEAGTHTGQVTVDKSVSVRGEGPSNTTYDAFDVNGGGSLTSGRDLGMQIRADDVRVGDLTATGADQVIQFNDNSGSNGRLSGAMISNVVAENNGNNGRGRAVVVNYTDGAIIRDTVIRQNGNDGLTLWYTNDSHVETVTVNDNEDNGIYINGDNNILLDSEAKGNTDEGVDVNWYQDLSSSQQRVTLDNVVAENNGQDDVELHDNGNDDAVADNSMLLRKVQTGGAPTGLRMVAVDESEVAVANSSFPNGKLDGNDNDVDP